MKNTKKATWRCIIRRLACDTDWWAGFPGLQYGKVAIDDMAVACVRWMDKWWSGPDNLARWETNAAATRIMNAAAITLAGTCTAALVIRLTVKSDALISRTFRRTKS